MGAVGVVFTASWASDRFQERDDSQPGKPAQKAPTNTSLSADALGFDTGSVTRLPRVCRVARDLDGAKRFKDRLHHLTYSHVVVNLTVRK